MKKYLILAAMAVLTLASCAKTIHTARTTDRDVPIGFNTAVGVPTKTDITTAVYPTDGTFKVWALFLATNDFNIATNYSSSGSMFMNGVEMEYKGSGESNKYWAAKTGAYYWPKAGYLNFWAVSPATVSPTVAMQAASKSITVTDFTPGDIDPATTNDLLFSDIVANKSGTDYTGTNGDDTTTGNDTGFPDYWGVNILFHHALSRIEFQAKLGSNVNSNETIKLTNITVGSVLPTGTATISAVAPTSTYSAGDVSWAATGTAADLVLLNAATGALSGTAVPVGSARLIVPQTSTGKTITVTVQSTISGISATKDYTITLAAADHGGAWEWGKRYIYTITVDENEIHFDPAVVDWTGVNVDKTI